MPETRNRRYWLLFLGVSLCDCASASPGGGSAGNSPAPGLDGGGSAPGPDLITYQSGCAGVPAASDTLTSATLAFTLAYPPTWHDATTQSDLPTLLSNDQQGRVQADRYYLGNPSQDPLAVIRSGAGTVQASRDVTIEGHPGVAYWSRDPAPVPGCATCNASPGPDIITIGVGLSMGSGEILNVLGTAAVTADPQVFCAMQAILETFTPTR
jgi:hypothetical protein